MCRCPSQLLTGMCPLLRVCVCACVRARACVCVLCCVNRSRVPLDGLGGPNVPAAAAGALEVGAGLKHSLHLPLSEPELALSWCWSTDGYDLACAVYFR